MGKGHATGSVWVRIGIGSDKQCVPRRLRSELSEFQQAALHYHGSWGGMEAKVASICCCVTHASHTLLVTNLFHALSSVIRVCPICVWYDVTST